MTQPLALHARAQGDGPPLVLLHGLFGSAENLGGIARLLAARFTVWSLDLRNHGRSPHSPHHTYPLMAADVAAWMDHAGLAQAAFLGHSMGGKVAMQLALTAPERVSKLVVADIAPVSYSPHHDHILEGLQALELSALNSRDEADQALRPYVPETPVRQFLLKNLVKSGAAGFAWRLNLAAIIAQYPNILLGQVADAPYEGPTLFIKGGSSDYVLDRHRDTVARFFPRATLKIIPGTGHWLHAEKPAIFAGLAERFLLDLPRQAD